MKAFLSLLICCLALSGCSSVAVKRQKALSQAVYAENSAIAAGRFDLAKSYGAQAVRLTAPPKKAIEIKPVESQGKKYVVLPVEWNGTPTLAIGSPALNTLVASDKALQGQMRAEDKALAQVTKETDKVITSEAKDAAKQEARPSFWHKFTFFGIPFLLVGLAIAACVFFPPLIPVLVSICKTLFGFLESGIGFVVSIINKTLSWLKPK